MHDGRHQQSQQRAARGRSHDDGPAQRYAEYHEFFGKQPHDQQAEATADKHDGHLPRQLGPIAPEDLPQQQYRHSHADNHPYRGWQRA